MSKAPMFAALFLLVLTGCDTGESAPVDEPWLTATWIGYYEMSCYGCRPYIPEEGARFRCEGGQDVCLDINGHGIVDYFGNDGTDSKHYRSSVQKELGDSFWQQIRGYDVASLREVYLARIAADAPGIAEKESVHHADDLGAPVMAWLGIFHYREYGGVGELINPEEFEIVDVNQALPVRGYFLLPVEDPQLLPLVQKLRTLMQTFEANLDPLDPAWRP